MGVACTMAVIGKLPFKAIFQQLGKFFYIKSFVLQVQGDLDEKGSRLGSWGSTSLIHRNMPDFSSPKEPARVDDTVESVADIILY